MFSFSLASISELFEAKSSRFVEPFTSMVYTFPKTEDIVENLKREPLVNEVEIDVAGKNIEEVLNEAIEIIDTREPLLDYEYVKPPKELFYSWVFANGLR